MTGTSQKPVVLAGTSPSVRDAMRDILTSRGVDTFEFNSVDECRESLAELHQEPAVVVELNGDAERELQSLADMKQEHPQTSVLALVDHGDVPTAVKAIKAGALNCLEKPIEAEQLTAVIDELLDKADLPAGHLGPPLTPMEMTVLGHILEGKTSRQIADALYRSPRTIEVHRSHIMHKLHVSTMVDLVKAASTIGLLGASGHPPSRPARTRS
jgi:FixJ family two-component response regulator